VKAIKQEMKGEKYNYLYDREKVVISTVDSFQG
jgi:hypothetical protein